MIFMLLFSLSNISSVLFATEVKAFNSIFALFPVLHVRPRFLSENIFQDAPALIYKFIFLKKSHQWRYSLHVP